jgi:phenylalanyl-tRNA synthetase alpha chain
MEDAGDIAQRLSASERRVLLSLVKADGAMVEALQRAGGFRELVEVMNAASWLASKGLVRIGERIAAGPEAVDAAERGLPERRALTALAQTSMASVADIESATGMPREEVGVAMGQLKKRGWAEVRRSEGGEVVLELTEAGDAAAAAGPGPDERLVTDVVLAGDRGLPMDGVDSRAYAPLKGRKALVRVREEVRRTLHLTSLGREVASVGLEAREVVAQLTPQMLRTGRWREVELRPYDVGAYAPALHGGRPHPVRETLERVRSVFKQMGFLEIFGDFVESAFWDMDVLFVPQDHPARDLQDTLYLSEPSVIDVDASLMDRVRRVHIDGGDTGSRGWGGQYSEEEARRALLRTHTTVLTIRHLSEHPDPPLKVFSLGRCFRRESIDFSHLPEFYQIEGIVMEQNASFAMLVGVMREFYTRLGFEDIRVRPGYFPYTEPSMEVEVLFNGRWLEMGGSGVFRPEVTAPFGVKHPVLAWGQGLERIAMVMYGLDDIRQLYETDLGWLRTRPLG